MLPLEGFRTLLGIDVSAKAPNILVFAETISERLKYTCRFIFNHALNLNFELTDNVAEFEKQQGFKVNYSARQIPDSFRIYPEKILFEREISRAKPVPVLKEGMIYFFENREDFHFDIFASVFYFISRYEEWQEYKPDTHGRFEARESILFSRGFHLKPVVDIWIKEFAGELSKTFPTLRIPEKKFRVISTIDVDNLFAYRSKGVLRTVGATLKDTLKLDLTNIKDRMLVLSGKKKDPFDIYEEISNLCFDLKIPLIYFFLFRTGTTHDRTVNPSNPAFKKVFDIVKSNKALIGLHPSYHSSYSPGILQAELDHLSHDAKERISLSRQHYLRFDIRTTPNLLLNAGITTDFSMGFASALGFRAGTTIPFHYYDLINETDTGLLFVPFCTMDGVYMIYNKVKPDEAFISMQNLADEIKKVNGLFISVFHERTFSDHLYPGFGSLYKKLLIWLKD